MAVNFDGPYPSELSGLPQSALRDGAFVRDGNVLTLTLNNLPVNTSYSFLIYGAAANIGDYSVITVNGSNSDRDVIDDLVNNDSQVAIVNHILPDAMQKIAILFEGRLPNGMPQLPNVNNDGLGRFNYMRITQHTQPQGDFNGDTLANTADYDAWRRSYGSDSNLAADGSGNGIVDAADYVVWRNAIISGGAGLAANLSSVPEPASVTMSILLVLGASLMSTRRVGRRC